MNRTYVSFDWAIKKLFRDKANFDVLEGFLSELLTFQVKIEQILESESNKNDNFDKFNRVDILVKSDKNDLILIELQYDSEQDYFHRMLYGISKLLVEYIQEGSPYGEIKKAYSINIIYFDLGQGEDYMYEYKGEFVGLNLKDILVPSLAQKRKFTIEKVSDIFPKYYIIKAGNFKKSKVENNFDEWVYFLQNSEIPEDFQAQGIKQAREKLRYEKMPNVEKEAYERFVNNRRIELAVTESAKEEGFQEGIKQGEEIGIAKGIQKGEEIGIAKGIQKTISKGMKIEEVAELFDVSIEYIQQIISKNK